VSRPSDSPIIVLSSSIGGLEFLLPVVFCIEEYTRARDYEEADVFNAEFGEDEADGFAGVGAALVGGNAGRVGECRLCRRRRGVSERRVCLRVRMHCGVIQGGLSRPPVMSGVWVAGWIIWRRWGAGGLIERWALCFWEFLGESEKGEEGREGLRRQASRWRFGGGMGRDGSVSGSMFENSHADTEYAI
jgi:hypothetical protein